MDKKSRAVAQARLSGLESEGEGLENEGDANRIAARRYNEMSRAFVAPGKPAEAAREAKEAIEGAEGEEFLPDSDVEDD